MQLKASKSHYTQFTQKADHKIELCVCLWLPRPVEHGALLGYCQEGNQIGLQKLLEEILLN